MNEKPRLVPITDISEFEELLDSQDSLAAPRLFKGISMWYADAAELRAWRAARTTHQSDVEAT